MRGFKRSFFYFIITLHFEQLTYFVTIVLFPTNIGCKLMNLKTYTVSYKKKGIARMFTKRGVKKELWFGAQTLGIKITLFTTDNT